MALSRSGFADNVTVGFDKFHFDAVQTGKPSDAIYNDASSGKQSEKSSSLITGGHLATKDEGDSGNTLSAYQGYDEELTHLTYQGYLEITEELLEDDLTGTIKRLPQGLAYIAANTKEQIRMAFLVAGFTTAGADGSYIWATDHNQLGSSSYGNRPSTELDISPANFRTALSSFYKLEDHYGTARELMPSTLLCAPQEYYYTNEIVNSGKIADGGNNNETQWKGIVQVVQSARWTDEDAWALFADKSQHGFVSYDRIPANVRALDNSDSDFATGNMRMQVRMRMSVGDEMSGLGTWGTTGI